MSLCPPADKKWKCQPVTAGEQDVYPYGVGEASSQIPEWIRNNASWWVAGNIDDQAFVGGIQFLIKEGIIQIPETAKSSTTLSGSQEIPAWIKNNADWWSQGLISDDDFLKGITFLVENGIITV